MAVTDSNIQVQFKVGFSPAGEIIRVVVSQEDHSIEMTKEQALALAEQIRVRLL